MPPVYMIFILSFLWRFYFRLPSNRDVEFDIFSHYWQILPKFVEWTFFSEMERSIIYRVFIAYIPPNLFDITFRSNIAIESWYQRGLEIYENFRFRFCEHLSRTGFYAEILNLQLIWDSFSVNLYFEWSPRQIHPGNWEWTFTIKNLRFRKKKHMDLSSFLLLF